MLATGPTTSAIRWALSNAWSHHMLGLYAYHCYPCTWPHTRINMGLCLSPRVDSILSYLRPLPHHRQLPWTGGPDLAEQPCRLLHKRHFEGRRDDVSKNSGHWNYQGIPTGNLWNPVVATHKSDYIYIYMYYPHKYYYAPKRLAPRKHPYCRLPLMLTGYQT